MTECQHASAGHVSVALPCMPCSIQCQCQCKFIQYINTKPPMLWWLKCTVAVTLNFSRDLARSITMWNINGECKKTSIIAAYAEQQQRSCTLDDDWLHRVAPALSITGITNHECILPRHWLSLLAFFWVVSSPSDDVTMLSTLPPFSSFWYHLANYGTDDLCLSSAITTGWVRVRCSITSRSATFTELLAVSHKTVSQWSFIFHKHVLGRQLPTIILMNTPSQPQVSITFYTDTLHLRTFNV